MTYRTIFFAGFVSFIILNFIENVLHYSIGRSYKRDYRIIFPSQRDIIRIILIMFIFAVLQGLLTLFIDYFENQ